LNADFEIGQTLNYLLGLILSSEEEVENNYIENLMTLKTTNTAEIDGFFSIRYIL